MPIVAFHGMAKFCFGRHGEDHTHRNAGSAEFGTQGLDETDLCRLGRTVAAHLRDSTLTDNRRDHDQMASRLGSKDWQRRTGPVKGSHEVHIHHSLHRLRRRVLDRSVVPEAGIADHDVEPAECVERALHQLLHVGFGCNLGHDSLGAAAAGADAGDCFVEAIGAARAENDRDTATREVLRDRQSDAGRRSRHYRDAT